jgi:hypothetical protein
LLALYCYFYRYKAAVAVEIFFNDFFLLFLDILILELLRLIMTAAPPFGSELVPGETNGIAYYTTYVLCICFYSFLLS